MTFIRLRSLLFLPCCLRARRSLAKPRRLPWRASSQTLTAARLKPRLWPS